MLESLFDNVAGLQPETLKKRLYHRCFPVNIVKFLKTANRTSPVAASETLKRMFVKLFS